MAAPSLTVDPRSLPAEGRRLQGSLPPAFFGLTKDDPTRPTGPLTFDLHAQRDDDNLILSGQLHAPFQFDCVRCLQPFDFEVALDSYAVEIPIENEQIIDLTESLREDILLALPSYPRCEDSNVQPRDCAAEGRFDRDSTQEPEKAAPESTTGVWDALDQLKS